MAVAPEMDDCHRKGQWAKDLAIYGPAPNQRVLICRGAVVARSSPPRSAEIFLAVGGRGAVPPALPTLTKSAPPEPEPTQPQQGDPDGTET